MTQHQDNAIETTTGGEPFPSDEHSLTIGADGTVSVTVPGQSAPQQLGQILIADFINPAGLQPKGENLYTETAASGAAATASCQSSLSVGA